MRKFWVKFTQKEPSRYHITGVAEIVAKNNGEAQDLLTQHWEKCTGEVLGIHENFDFELLNSELCFPWEKRIVEISLRPARRYEPA